MLVKKLNDGSVLFKNKKGTYFSLSPDELESLFNIYSELKSDEEDDNVSKDD